MKVKLESGGDCGSDKDRGCCVGIGLNESGTGQCSEEQKPRLRPLYQKKGRSGPNRLSKSDNLEDECMRTYIEDV